MVCLGNICRSPLAEGILRSKLDPEKFEVASAGTGNWHVGEKPDKRSIAVAKKNGLDISGQRGRHFSVSDFDYFDHIFVMDNSNKNNVLKLARNQTDCDKVSLILGPTAHGKGTDVPDPYYGGPGGFENVHKLLEGACRTIAQNLTAQKP